MRRENDAESGKGGARLAGCGAGDKGVSENSAAGGVLPSGDKGSGEMTDGTSPEAFASGSSALPRALPLFNQCINAYAPSTPPIMPLRKHSSRTAANPEPEAFRRLV